MAYSRTSFQLTHLLQDAWYRLGHMKRWKLTGGSATTAINTGWAGVEEQIFEDDDQSLIFGTLVVLEDAAGESPEGQWGQITNYDAASQTVTFDQIGAALAANDRVGLASPAFPVEDMIELANIAIQRLGEIEIPDTSLSIAGGQREYTLPSTIRQRPVAVNVQKNQDVGNYNWVPVQGWGVIPATAGSNWTLVVPSGMTQGFSLQVIYRALHPKLTAYDSDILPAIHPEVATAALLCEALQWYNSQVGGSDEYSMRRENKFVQDLEAALVRHPILNTPEQVQGFPHWLPDQRFVPGTSDLRDTGWH